MRTAPLAAFAAFIVLAGCGSGEIATGRIVVADSAGIEIRTSDPAGADIPLTPGVADEPHLRVGSVSGGVENQFTYILDALRLSDDRIVVAESGATRVRLFDPEGHFLWWIGAVGEGPEEYSSVGGMGVLEGDTIWVHDRIRRGFVLFLPSGQFVRSFRPDRPAEAPQFRRGRMLANGVVVDEGTNFDLSGVPEGAAEFVEDVVVSVMDRDGRSPRTIATAPGTRFTLGGAQMADGRQVNTYTSLYRFPSLPVFVVGADRVFRADPELFEFQEMSPEGTVRRIVRIQRPRDPLTPSMISGYEVALLERPGPRGTPVSEDRINQHVYPDSLPNFGEVLVDDVGRVWFSEYVEHHPGVEPRRWWRIGAEGGIDGYLDLPEAFRLVRVQGDELLGSLLDTLDVPYLVAYRMTG